MAVEAIGAIGAGKTNAAKKKEQLSLGDAAAQYGAKLATTVTNSIFGNGFADTSHSVNTSAAGL